MTHHESRDAHDEYPNGVDPLGLCDGCPDCDTLATDLILGLEVELRLTSLGLWVAGWTPADVLAEVRRVTGDPSAVDLTALVLIVDDSHRSEQARPREWVDEVAALRARTGFGDVAIGWLPRWIAAHAHAEMAAACLSATARALHDLVDPLAA